MRHPIRAAIIAFGALGALAGTAGAQPYQGNGTYDQGYGYGQGYGQGYRQNYGPGYDQGAPGYDQGYPPNYAPNYAPGQGYDPNYAGANPGYGPPAYDPYDNGYASSDYGYCDPYYGCPDDYYDLPVYDGSVFFDGGWYNGPFFWRDFGGHREFWLHGGWHGGQFRGGHFGSALGRDYFQRRGIGTFARGGNFGRQSFARFAPQRSFQQPAFNGSRGGFAGRSTFNAQPRAGFGGFEGRGGWNRGGGGGSQGHFQQQAQVQHGGGGGGWSHGGGGGGHGGGGGGHGGGDHHR